MQIGHQGVSDMKWVTEEIPFKLLGNRQVLTDQQVIEQPHLMEFIKLFPHCFEHDPHYNCFVYNPRSK